ncbi:hypothetical protein J2Z23_000188 [Lederbergia galactosidilyticus]|uniref:hypothetical protein n=1 Tax=Lederbergia galactosidilytica TaxID=217031 RepID=UPI001AE7F671|nr:hypothetical protein [Lederbergia galactosidilytica]MBP1913256.1 hypothetical protein [Lederbergia galactosidilytica]
MSIVSINRKTTEKIIRATMEKLGIPEAIFALEPTLKPMLLMAGDFVKCTEYLESGLYSKESSLQELERIRNELSGLLENHEKDFRDWMMDFMNETISEVERIN